MSSDMCPLCEQAPAAVTATCGARPLNRCPTCDLVFVPASHHVSLEQERERYELHTNNEQDAGYVAFLETVAAAIDRLPVPHPSILDFGSGPNQVLTGILRDKGYACDAYDPLYGIGPDVFSRRYDIVVLCEVFEHLRAPRAELERIAVMLKPRGFVVIRTLLRPDDIGALSSWWYARDITHLNFLSIRCCEHIAAMLDLAIVDCNGRSLLCLGPRPAAGARSRKQAQPLADHGDVSPSSCAENAT